MADNTRTNADQIRAAAEAAADDMNPRVLALGEALDQATEGKNVSEMLEIVAFVVACKLLPVVQAKPEDALGLCTMLQAGIANTLAALRGAEATAQADEDLKAAARGIPAEALASAFSTTYATDDAHANAIPAHEPHPVSAAVARELTAAERAEAGSSMSGVATANSEAVATLAESPVPVPALPDAGAGDEVEALDPFPKTAASVDHTPPVRDNGTGDA